MKKVLSMILVLLMMLSLAACGGERIVWDDIILGDMIPEPPVYKVEIHTNAADDLWLDINDLSDKQFNDYIEACKEMGFTVDAEYHSSSYNAYNAEGYELRLVHYSNDDMSIHLDAPMEMTTITWPTSVAGNMLPTPKSTIGKFSYEYEDHFYVYVGNTTRADYAEYVKACSEKGFNVDYSKGDDYYYADNSEGWHISVCYEGNNIMTIDIDAASEEDDNKNTDPATQPSTEPSTEATTPATEPSTEATTPATQPSTEATTPATEEKKDNNAIDPEFKAAMDSYEEFMDEYVAFMKKYKANPNDLSLFADYANYMSKYAEFLEDFAKWEDEEMNAAETAYYIDVQARVSKKLLEVA